jgi:hypothetical protein
MPIRSSERARYPQEGRRRSSGRGGLVPPGVKVCSAQLRRRTPRAFAEWLVHLARGARAT